MRRLAILALLPLTLTGCVTASLVSTGAEVGVTAAENRSVGRKVDDTVIYTDLANQFVQENQAALLGKVTFNVRYARVMLTGNVDTDDEAQRAVALSWKAKGVTEVINELNVGVDHSFYNTAEDSVIKRNLESRLLITKGVWVINYSMDVTNGTAYLIGRVKDADELNRALNVARTTRGVKRVVSHLQVNPDTTLVTPPPGPVSHDPNNIAPSPATSNAPAASSYSPPASSGNSGSDVYTGPVYSGGSISSGDISAPKNGGY